MESWLSNLESIGLQNQAIKVNDYFKSYNGLPAYGLGWRTFPSLEFSGSGNIEGSLGHTGFTGTSLWMNIDNQQSAILLNNRVYPSRLNTCNSINEFRIKIHQLCFDQQLAF